MTTPSTDATRADVALGCLEIARVLLFALLKEHVLAEAARAHLSSRVVQIDVSTLATWAQDYMDPDRARVLLGELEARNFLVSLRPEPARDLVCILREGVRMMRETLNVDHDAPTVRAFVGDALDMIDTLDKSLRDAARPAAWLS